MPAAQNISVPIAKNTLSYVALETSQAVDKEYWYILLFHVPVVYIFVQSLLKAAALGVVSSHVRAKLFVAHGCVLFK